MCDDTRDEEAAFARGEAEGQHHDVKMRVTMQATVTMPGSAHTSDDLSDYLDEVLGNGEIVDWGEV